MIQFLTDENFSSAILRGLLRREPSIDIVRVQDHNLRGTDDPVILQWAAEHTRVVLTHDLRTMPAFAYERLARGEEMTGMIAMRQDVHIGTAIDDILLVWATMPAEEMVGVVLRLPL